MKLFQSKAEKELDAIIEKLEMNMSNNYKDAAQENFQRLEDTFDHLKACGDLKPKAVEAYEERLETYRLKLKGYTHKDQKPYWT